MISDEPKELPQQTVNGITWLCIEKPTKAIFKQLETTYNLHPVHLKESTQIIQLTEVEREDHYVFLLVHLPTYIPETNQIQTSQVGVFLGKDFVITIHDGRRTVLNELFKDCETDSEMADATFKHSSGFLLYSLLKQLLENVSETIEAILNELDDVEIVVFDNNKSDAYQIGKLRQKIIRLRRVVDPLQSVLQDLAQQINDFSQESLSKYYFNNAKLAKKLSEVIGEAQETVEIYKDADFTTSTEQTNQILTVLTLVFTFTIPVTVFGTLYGMNVPVPGGLNPGAWTFLGEYTTFIMILFGAVTGAVAMYAFFRNRKWL